MKSLYNKIFKNNQVTYGIPFQVRIPVNLRNLKSHDIDEEKTDNAKDSVDIENPELILSKAKEEAEMIIKEAELEAAKIIEKNIKSAETKAREIEEEAWQKGYAEGSDAARVQYESLIKEAEDIKASSMEEHDSVIAGMEAEIINLVLDISKKVIGYELEVNKANMLYLVKQALERCSNKNNAIIKVSSDDFEYLSENKDKLLEMIEGTSEIEIKQDLSLKAGACTIETPFGNVDAGIQTKLQNIEEAFIEVLEGK